MYSVHVPATTPPPPPHPTDTLGGYLGSIGGGRGSHRSAQCIEANLCHCSGDPSAQRHRGVKFKLLLQAGNSIIWGKDMLLRHILAVFLARREKGRREGLKASPLWLKQWGSSGGGRGVGYYPTLSWRPHFLFLCPPRPCCSQSKSLGRMCRCFRVFAFLQIKPISGV